MPAVEVHRLEQGAAEAHDRGALDLVREVVGIDDRAALEGGHDAEDLEPVAVDADERRRSPPGRPSRARRRCPSRPRRRVGADLPAEALGGRDRSTGTRAARRRGVAEPELAAGRRRAVGQLVDERLAGEVVGRRRQCPVGALAQRRVGRLEPQPLVGHVVVGTPIAALPELMLTHSQAVSVAVGGRAGAHVDDRRRPEVGPGELLLARPLQPHGPARRPGEARGRDGDVGLVLAAEPGARVGDDHPHLGPRPSPAPRPARGARRTAAACRSRRSAGRPPTRRARPGSPAGRARCRRSCRSRRAAPAATRARASKSPASWRTHRPTPRPSTGWVRRCDSRSASSTGSARSHAASIASHGARRPPRRWRRPRRRTRPRRTTVTPGSARARDTSTERRRAPRARRAQDLGVAADRDGSGPRRTASRPSPPKGRRRRDVADRRPATRRRRSSSRSGSATSTQPRARSSRPARCSAARAAAAALAQVLRPRSASTGCRRCRCRTGTRRCRPSRAARRRCGRPAPRRRGGGAPAGCPAPPRPCP